VNDGEWWDADDIIKEESTVKIATLSGRLVDQNKNSFSNTKLSLVSDDNTYTDITNINGKFMFKNFIAGFYELYVVDSSGNIISTGYYTNFYDGDVATLNLTCDSSKTSVTSTENSVDSTSVGSIEGTVYTPSLETVAGLKVYIPGIGETVTDENGSFAFNDISVGEYEVYTNLPDGSEYLFRTISIKENVELTVKLKYDTASNASADGDDGSNWLWIVVICGAVVLVAAGVVAFVIIKKKKTIKI